MHFDLPKFTVSGTPQEMGRQYGSQCRAMIHAFVADREAAVEAYFKERGFEGTAELFEAGAGCLDQVRTFDPAGHVEHLGIAEGADIDPIRLFTTTNMTDVRDIILLPEDPPVVEDEGCTAALLPPEITRDGQALQGQTWDLNGPDVEYVIALHRIPDEGPETWTVTCAGCQTLMGMNTHGVTVGTTNLKTKGAKIGIPYLSVLHLALGQTTLEAASAIFERTPVAGSHSYWAGDATQAIEWERSPSSARSRTTGDGPLARTNHCLFEENIALETDLSPSTHQRFSRMERLLDQSGDHTPETMKKLFADRSDGRLSINRFAEDDSGATTNAVVVCNPADLEFWACRGQADKGVWERLEFEKQPATAL
ncbi:C45 family peptidase [Parasphingopyxis sp.]|uniref:C45 family autoproteolytic acyltransferase/hydolase n=1 Tax=Parasphingopyxis sp. TaxID=1920299 RepID=UPI002634769A|nr:C45 family peptidase [Parasphingopyxis sp.]